jgi:DNA-binding NarL/FixJ family response regulator
MRRWRSRPALRQHLAQVVHTIAPLQHINHVLGNLAMANRTEAVGRARRPGLIR